jgi:hypothetical protein
VHTMIGSLLPSSLRPLPFPPHLPFPRPPRFQLPLLIKLV